MYDSYAESLHSRLQLGEHESSLCEMLDKPLRPSWKFHRVKSKVGHHRRPQHRSMVRQCVWNYESGVLCEKAFEILKMTFGPFMLSHTPTGQVLFLNCFYQPVVVIVSALLTALW